MNLAIVSFLVIVAVVAAAVIYVATPGVEVIESVVPSTDCGSESMMDDPRCFCMCYYSDFTAPGCDRCSKGDKRAYCLVDECTSESAPNETVEINDTPIEDAVPSDTESPWCYVGGHILQPKLGVAGTMDYVVRGKVNIDGTEFCHAEYVDQKSRSYNVYANRGLTYCVQTMVAKGITVNTVDPGACPAALPSKADPTIEEGWN